jgi:hypothetical protein
MMYLWKTCLTPRVVRLLVGCTLYSMADPLEKMSADACQDRRPPIGSVLAQRRICSDPWAVGPILTIRLRFMGSPARTRSSTVPPDPSMRTVGTPLFAWLKSSVGRMLRVAGVGCRQGRLLYHAAVRLTGRMADHG